jgi:hypothetical protein
MKFNKLLALLLAVLMIFTQLPVMAAEDEAAQKLLDSYAYVEGLYTDDKERILSKDEFYNTLNTGGEIRMSNGEIFNHDRLQRSMSDIDTENTDGNYADYLDLRMKERYGSNYETGNSMTYYEDMFKMFMMGDNVVGIQGQETAFRGWETISQRYSDTIEHYTKAGGDV